MSMKSMTAKFDYKKKYLYITLTYKPNKLSKKIKFSIENIEPITLQCMLIEWIDKFCKKNPEYLYKEVLKAFAKADNLMKNIYKLEYPHGGFREKKSKQKPKIKSEQLGKRLTPEEKLYLLKCLEVYRVINPNEKDHLLKYIERHHKKYGRIPQKTDNNLIINKLLQEAESLDFSFLSDC